MIEFIFFYTGRPPAPTPEVFFRGMGRSTRARDRTDGVRRGMVEAWKQVPAND